MVNYGKMLLSIRFVLDVHLGKSLVPNLMVKSAAHVAHVHRLLHRVCKADGMAHRGGLALGLGAPRHHRRRMVTGPKCDQQIPQHFVIPATSATEKSY